MASKEELEQKAREKLETFKKENGPTKLGFPIEIGTREDFDRIITKLFKTAGGVAVCVVIIAVMLIFFGIVANLTEKDWDALATCLLAIPTIIYILSPIIVVFTLFGIHRELIRIRKVLEK